MYKSLFSVLTLIKHTVTDLGLYMFDSELFLLETVWKVLDYVGKNIWTNENRHIDLQYTRQKGEASMEWSEQLFFFIIDLMQCLHANIL